MRWLIAPLSLVLTSLGTTSLALIVGKLSLVRVAPDPQQLIYGGTMRSILMIVTTLFLLAGCTVIDNPKFHYHDNVTFHHDFYGNCRGYVSKPLPCFNGCGYEVFVWDCGGHSDVPNMYVPEDQLKAGQ